AGCGPTVGAHLIWYLSRTRMGYEGLCAFDANTRQGMLKLMQASWGYITPTMHGVNKTSILEQGIKKYARDRGKRVKARVLDIQIGEGKRPSMEEVSAFLVGAIGDDLPVAFLNLSNGKLNNLDNWHWVTLVGFDPRTRMALMYDQGVHKEIDLALWLKSTLLGGGFVAVEPGE
ncbi:hypothetical protein LJC20_05450, partial [Eubacteriales bacterium OttesenSCG-928-M02]|nr:hypothetical protein [Eubacteriales bacterium OttesenSCG-928-M02]